MADWEQIRMEYATEEVTCKELAERHGLSERTVSGRCAREKWAEDREKHAQKVRDGVLASRARAKVRQVDKLIEHSDRLNDLIARYEAAAQAAGAVPTAKELQHLSTALKNAVDITRSLWSEPDQAEKERQRIARARLRLEKERTEAELDRQDEQGNVGDVRLILRPIKGMEQENGEEE